MMNPFHPVALCLFLAVASPLALSMEAATPTRANRMSGGVATRIRDCSTCVDAGFGWGPIRRACGGFSNRECYGGNDERDFAFPVIHAVTSMDDLVELEDTTTTRAVFFYHSKHTSEETLEALEGAASDLYDETGIHGVEFFSVDVRFNGGVGKHFAVNASSLQSAQDTSDAAVLRVLLRSTAPPSEDGAEDGAKAEGQTDPSAAAATHVESATFDYTGPWTIEDIRQFVFDRVSARTPALDAITNSFVAAYLESLGHEASSKGAEEANAEMDFLIDDAERIVAGLKAPHKQAGGRVYLDVMNRLRDPKQGMPWLAGRVNGLRGSSQFTDELEITTVFAMELLG